MEQPQTNPKEDQHSNNPNEVPANEQFENVGDGTTESKKHGTSSGEPLQGEKLSKKEKQQFKKMLEDSLTKLKIGQDSESASLYIIVNGEELEKLRKIDEKKREETFESEICKSVKYCGTVFSMNLPERMANKRNSNTTKQNNKKKRDEERKNGTNQKSEKTKGQIEKEKREEESIIEDMKDCKMLEIVTYTKDSIPQDTPNYPYEVYIIILEFAVHFLLEDFPKLRSNPGLGKHAACINWYCIDAIKKDLSIMKGVKQKVLEALKDGKYVEEVISCERCWTTFSTKSNLATHQIKLRCPVDKHFFQALGEVFTDRKSASKPTLRSDDKQGKSASKPTLRSDDKQGKSASKPITKSDRKQGKSASKPTLRSDDKQGKSASKPITKSDRKQGKSASKPITKSDRKQGKSASKPTLRSDDKQGKSASKPITRSDGEQNFWNFSVEEFQIIFNRFQVLCIANKGIKYSEVYSYDSQKFSKNAIESIILLLGSKDPNGSITYTIEFDGKCYEPTELKEMIDKEIKVTYETVKAEKKEIVQIEGINVERDYYDLSKLKFELIKSNTGSNDQV